MRRVLPLALCIGALVTTASCGDGNNNVFADAQWQARCPPAPTDKLGTWVGCGWAGPSCTSAQAQCVCACAAAASVMGEGSS